MHDGFEQLHQGLRTNHGARKVATSIVQQLIVKDIPLDLNSSTIGPLRPPHLGGALVDQRSRSVRSFPRQRERRRISEISRLNIPFAER